MPGYLLLVLVWISPARSGAGQPQFGWIYVSNIGWQICRTRFQSNVSKQIAEGIALPRFPVSGRSTEPLDRSAQSIF